MKRLAFVILGMALISAMPKAAFAANGDIVGNIYQTDIRAFINGVEVESYCIDGKTAVVVEDILNATDYIYNDATRRLKIFSLDPQFIVEGKSKNTGKIGKVVGHIYETDIKTSIYGVDVTSYAIDGKTAVAIEDLGCDGVFSEIGGKYIWNDSERTISLEFMYENSNIISDNLSANITFNNEMTEGTATFEEMFHCGGGMAYFKYPDKVTTYSDISVEIPIKANGEIIGYRFRRSYDDSFVTFVYFYPQKLAEAEKNYTPCSVKTREEIIEHFNHRHIGGYVERFDTEDYSFVYYSLAGTSWTVYNLVQAYDDGTFTDYAENIRMQNRSPLDLVIDRENEKVTFRYGDRYTPEWFTDYEIDLKAGTIKAVEKIEQ